MKHFFTLILMISMFAFIGCEADDGISKNSIVPDSIGSDDGAEDPVVTDPETPVVTVPSPIVIEVTPDPVKPEVFLTVKSFWMKPIADDYDFYYFCETSGSVYGFKGMVKERVNCTGLIYYNETEEPKEVVFNPRLFFTRNGNVYMKWCCVPEHYDKNGNPVANQFMNFKQVDGVISEANYTEMTSAQNPDYGTYASSNFEVYISVYNGKPVSDIKNLYKTGSGAHRFRQVTTGIFEVTDGGYMETGLFFDVWTSEVSGKTEGLYWYYKDQTSINCIIPEKGRIWIL